MKTNNWNCTYIFNGKNDVYDFYFLFWLYQEKTLVGFVRLAKACAKTCLVIQDCGNPVVILHDET